ncbi:MAG: hypothetical protein PHE50_00560 [Dehalococcoidales bacterium]|nr:hypothetical protein [Dehalococcoidales bacterium]
MNLDYPYPQAEYGIYEYCGIQRSGKTTLMNADICFKFLNKHDYAFAYEPKDIYVNWVMDITGVNCVDNEQMKWVLLKAKKENWIHKAFFVDECSQIFYARNSRDLNQTELVTSLWQMPKKGTVCGYSSNVGNSVDVQMRDATWYCVLPKYIKGEVRELDKIKFKVAHAYEVWERDGIFHKPAYVQTIFDSFAPVK